MKVYYKLALKDFSSTTHMIARLLDKWAAKLLSFMLKTDKGNFWRIQIQK